MAHPLEAKSGQTHTHEEFAGPSSYPTGGFSQRSDLGRVDAAMGEADNGSWETVMSAQSSNDVVVTVFSQGGGEVAAGTDLSTDTFTGDFYRL